MEKNKGKKALQIALSILIAVAVWLYVDLEQSPDVTMSVKDIPVEFSGEDTALADNGLMLLSGYDTTIDLKLKGPRKILMQMDRDEIRIVADTSGITSTGVQTLSYQVIFPANVSRSDIRVEKASIYVVTVTVGELYTKEVPIQYEVIGQPADGFRGGTVTLDPEVLVLRGQRDDLLSVSYAKVTLDISGAEKDVVSALNFKLYDYNDIEVDNDAIRSDVRLVQAVMPITTTKEVPLKINFEEAPGSTMDQVECTISPKTVVLSGEKEILDSVDEIVLDTIYLQDLQPSQSLVYDIPVPDGTSLPEDTTQATVTIVVTGVSERTVTVDQFTCTNIPDGYSATVTTDSLRVTLRGLSEELDALTVENIRVAADLSDVTQTGPNTVPAVIQISGYEHVGAKGSYQVIVDVTTAENGNTDTAG